jgi:hypothetical protein
MVVLHDVMNRIILPFWPCVMAGLWGTLKQPSSYHFVFDAMIFTELLLLSAARLFAIVQWIGPNDRL